MLGYWIIEYWLMVWPLTMILGKDAQREKERERESAFPHKPFQRPISFSGTEQHHNIHVLIHS